MPKTKSDFRNVLTTFIYIYENVLTTFIYVYRNVLTTVGILTRRLDTVQMSKSLRKMISRFFIGHSTNVVGNFLLHSLYSSCLY